MSKNVVIVVIVIAVLGIAGYFGLQRAATPPEESFIPAPPAVSSPVAEESPMTEEYPAADPVDAVVEEAEDVVEDAPEAVVEPEAEEAVEDTHEEAADDAAAPAGVALDAETIVGTEWQAGQFVLVFEADGVAVARMGSSETRGTWSIEGDTVTVSGGGGTVSATIDGDKLLAGSNPLPRLK